MNINIKEENQVDYTPFTSLYELGNNKLVFQVLIDTCAYSSNYIDNSIAYTLQNRKDKGVTIY